MQFCWHFQGELTISKSTLVTFLQPQYLLLINHNKLVVWNGLLHKDNKYSRLDYILIAENASLWAFLRTIDYFQE